MIISPIRVDKLVELFVFANLDGFSVMGTSNDEIRLIYSYEN